HEVGQLARHYRERGLPVAGLGDVEAGLGEGRARQAPRARVVVDDEYAGGGAHAASLISARSSGCTFASSVSISVTRSAAPAVSPFLPRRSRRRHNSPSACAPTLKLADFSPFATLPSRAASPAASASRSWATWPGTSSRYIWITSFNTVPSSSIA